MNNSEKKQDSNSPVFRAKEEVSENDIPQEPMKEGEKQSNPTKTSGKDWKDNPFLYSQTEKKPFAVEVFGIPEVFEEMDEDTKKDIKLLDWYFQKKVQGKEYANNSKAYREFVKELERKTETENKPLDVKLKRFRSFIKYLTEVTKL